MKNGVIAILDVLGTKGIWLREDTKEVVRKWDVLLNDFEDFKKFNNEDPKSSGKANVKSFSDTIIITHTGDEYDELGLLNDMGFHLSLPFCNALVEGIFLRGAISTGKFEETENMVIGPAVDEAVAYYQRYDWIGISVSPSASFLLDEYLNDGDKLDWFSLYDVPVSPSMQLSNSTENVWVLKWPTTLKDAYIFQENDLVPKSLLLHKFSETIIMPDVISKYKNTITYYNKIMD